MFEMFATLGKWNARREICSTSHIAGRRRYENTELRPSFLRRKVASFPCLDDSTNHENGPDRDMLTELTLASRWPSPQRGVTGISRLSLAPLVGYPEIR